MMWPMTYDAWLNSLDLLARVTSHDLRREEVQFWRPIGQSRTSSCSVGNYAKHVDSAEDTAASGEETVHYGHEPPSTTLDPPASRYASPRLPDK